MLLKLSHWSPSIGAVMAYILQAPEVLYAYNQLATIDTSTLYVPSIMFHHLIHAQVTLRNPYIDPLCQ